MSRKKVVCKWCGLFKEKKKNIWGTCLEKHVCPVVFVHRVKEKHGKVEYVLRGDSKYLSQEWLGENILIRVQAYRPERVGEQK